MAVSKSSASLRSFLAVNLLIFALVSACNSSPNPNPKPKPIPSPKPQPTARTPTREPTPSPPTPEPSPSPPSLKPTPIPPTPEPNPIPPTQGSCPRDALKLGVCANVLNGLLNVKLGKPPTTPCCSLIQGLTDLDAAVCLCTALRANILGINLNVPLSLRLLLNVCSKNVPRDFKCA